MYIYRSLLAFTLNVRPLLSGRPSPQFAASITFHNVDSRLQQPEDKLQIKWQPGNAIQESFPMDAALKNFGVNTDLSADLPR